MLYDVIMLLPYARNRCACKEEFKSIDRLKGYKMNKILTKRKKAMMMKKSNHQRNDAMTIK
jgi:hypothetical protein